MVWPLDRLRVGHRIARLNTLTLCITTSFPCHVGWVTALLGCGLRTGPTGESSRRGYHFIALYSRTSQPVQKQALFSQYPIQPNTISTPSTVARATQARDGSHLSPNPVQTMTQVESPGQAQQAPSPRHNQQCPMSSIFLPCLSKAKKSKKQIHPPVQNNHHIVKRMSCPTMPPAPSPCRYKTP